LLLKDKVVVVSGIGPGLGIRLAIGAAREGASVVLAARTSSKLDDAELAIRQAGLQTSVLKRPTDITDPAQCEALMQEAAASLGGIDVLFNSAFVSGRLQAIENADLADWRSIMETNLYGSMHATLAAVPHMKRRGGGSIVMINSMVTRLPMALQGGYAVSKGALKTAASYLAKELGPYGIRVNSVFMGWMWGPPVQQAVEQFAAEHGTSAAQFKQGIETLIPLGRMQTDAECADAAIALASEHMRAVTGACLDVNGGHYLP